MMTPSSPQREHPARARYATATPRKRPKATPISPKPFWGILARFPGGAARVPKRDSPTPAIFVRRFSLDLPTQ